MKRILLLLTLLVSFMPVLAADNAYFDGYTKDEACAKITNEGYLKVTWPGADAMNSSYNMFTQDGQKILVYMVTLVKDMGLYVDNGYSYFLYSYNCVTKQTNEITGLKNGNQHYPLYVNTNQGISSIVLTDNNPNITRNRYYLILTLVKSNDSAKLIWKETLIDLYATEQLSFIGYDSAVEMYIAQLKKEAPNYKDIMLYNNEYQFGGSLESISDGSVVTFNDILQDNKGSKYGFKPEITFIDDTPFLVLKHFIYIHTDPIYKTSNEGTVIKMQMPSIIIPISNMRAGAGIDSSIGQYSITTEEIKRLYDQGLTKYRDLVGYNPNETFTREQAAKFYTQLAMNVFKKIPDVSKDCVFQDASSADQTLLNDIITSCQLGIFKGIRGKFEPKRPIVAEEAVAVLVRTVFGQEDETGHLWYIKYIEKAKEIGLLPEYGILYGFDINTPLSRGLIGKMIYQASQK